MINEVTNETENSLNNDHPVGGQREHDESAEVQAMPVSAKTFTRLKKVKNRTNGFRRDFDAV
jgi:hypothetical protein